MRSGGNLCRECNGLIKVLAVQLVIPAKLFFSLGKRAIRRRYFTISNSHRCCSAGWHKCLTALYVYTSRAQFSSKSIICLVFHSQLLLAILSVGGFILVN